MILSKKSKIASQAGHNSLAKDQLISIIERIERLKEEKSGISDDIREIFLEAKGNGFDNKTVREMIKLRAKESTKRDEEEHLRDMYMHALGLGVEMFD